MKKCLSFILFIGLIGVTGLFHACQEASPNTPSLQSPFAQANVSTPLPTGLQAMLDDYDRYFTDSLQITQTPGAAVVVVKDSQVVFIKGYGQKSSADPDPVDINTVFRIGSLSKGFAGVLTGILVQNGLLKWDEPVQKNYPEFNLRDPKQAKRIQIKHLLSHTCGLPYHAYTNLIEAGYDVPKIIREYFPKAPLAGKEGAVFSYQNVAICAIEEVMRSATGQSYQDLLQEKIFRPAGMRNASCDFSSIRYSQNRALPHNFTGYSWVPDSISTRYYNSAAAGGVNASINDMGAWLKLLLNNRPDIITENTLNEVFQPFIKTYNERRYFSHWQGSKEAFYAMGWRVLENQQDTIIYHAGYVNGFKGEIALNRKDGIAICVLFNANTDLSQACIPAFFNRWRAYKNLSK
jgi:beta-lactamase class C